MTSPWQGTDREDVDSPLFWELVAKYGPAFAQSPWSPEYLEPPLPTTVTGAIDHVKRLISSREGTQAMPILALDQYAQQVDLTPEQVEEILVGVLVDE